MKKQSFPRLKIAAWPAEDAKRWQNARSRIQLLGGRSAASWRVATARSAENGYGLYIGWLSDHGMLDAQESMEQRATPKRIEQFAAEYGVGRAPLTLAGAIRDIAMMLRACVPPDGLPWLTRLGFHMMGTAKPERSKLAHIESPEVLLRLGERIMEEGRDLLEHGHEDGARCYRDGLMIACLATRPSLRLRAFVTLRLGNTLSNSLPVIPAALDARIRLLRQFCSASSVRLCIGSRRGLDVAGAPGAIERGQGHDDCVRYDAEIPGQVHIPTPLP